jgi:hypothetical protein
VLKITGIVFSRALPPLKATPKPRRLQDSCPFASRDAVLPSP